jgi:hypothetical protein
MSIKFNQGGFSRDVARSLCRAVFELPRPLYSYESNSGETVCLEGPIAIDMNHCAPAPPLSDERLKSSNLPWLMWWDSGSADKWHYWYVHAKKQQKSSNKLGSQLITTARWRVGTMLWLACSRARRPMNT